MPRCSLPTIWLTLLVCLGSLPTRAQVSPGEVRLTAFAGLAFLANAPSRPIELGLSADARLFRLRHTALVTGVLAEGGLFHPALSGKGNYHFSGDAILAYASRYRSARATNLQPFAAAGYTRFFNATSSSLNSAGAVNFGVGTDLGLSADLRLRLEIREHYTPGSDTHALVLRIGIVAVGSIE